MLSNMLKASGAGQGREWWWWRWRGWCGADRDKGSSAWRAACAHACMHATFAPLTVRRMCRMHAYLLALAVRRMWVQQQRHALHCKGLDAGHLHQRACSCYETDGRHPPAGIGACAVSTATQHTSDALATSCGVCAQPVGAAPRCAHSPASSHLTGFTHFSTRPLPPHTHTRVPTPHAPLQAHTSAYRAVKALPEGGSILLGLVSHHITFEAQGTGLIFAAAK